LNADPATGIPPKLFDLDVVSTVSMPAGSFLVGSGDPSAAEIRDRMELLVEISFEHMDYFTKNLIAIRAEKRLCLVVKRGTAFITGSFAGLKDAPLKFGNGQPLLSPQ
jgi:HK97 family phage major capsid protein